MRRAALIFACGLVVAFAAFGQYDPPWGTSGNGPGGSGTLAPTTLVQGVPLTGTAFPSAHAGNLPAGDTVLYTAPAGKRALLLSIGGMNPTAGSITWFPEMRTVGGALWQIVGNSATGAGAVATTVFPGIILDPGESLFIHTSAAGMNVADGVVEFDATSAFRSVKLFGLATGNQVIYTPPAGKSAWVIGQGGTTYNGSSTIIIYNDSPGTGVVNLCFVPSGGPATCAANSVNELGTSTLTASARGSVSFAGFLTLSGNDFLVINVANGSANQLLWMNVYEL